jgi:hypothetical protein
MPRSGHWGAIYLSPQLLSTRGGGAQVQIVGDLGRILVEET